MINIIQQLSSLQNDVVSSWVSFSMLKRKNNFKNLKLNQTCRLDTILAYSVAFWTAKILNAFHLTLIWTLFKFLFVFKEKNAKCYTSFLNVSLIQAWNWFLFIFPSFHAHIHRMSKSFKYLNSSFNHSLFYVNVMTKYT